jgi:hypothetical protein
MGATNAGTALTITGTVFDAAGAPAAGVRLAVGSGPGTNLEVRSGGDGKYALTWQKFNPANGAMPVLFARDLERNAALGQDIDETTTNLDLHLQPGLTITVKVQDVNGKPITTATESLTSYVGGRAFHFDQSPSSADGRGVIEIKALPQGLVYTAMVTAQGYGSTNFYAPESETQSARFDFPVAVLRMADRKLAGQVLGPDSKPFAGALVRVPGFGQVIPTNTTDAQGHFALDAVGDGPLLVYAQTPGDRDEDFMAGGAQAQGGDTNVVVRLGVEVPRNGGELRMVTDYGTVFDASGAPVSGVRLDLSFGPLPIGVHVTNKTDGTYSIIWQMPDVPIGPPTAVLSGRDLLHNLALRQELDGTSAHLDLRLKPGVTLSVRVQDVNGNPIPAATATFSLGSGSQDQRVNQTPIKADEQGIIEIRALPQGFKYTATITAKGYGSATTQAQAGETEAAHFEFPTVALPRADRQIAGEVWGQDGKPVAKARVIIMGGGQPGANTTTDSKGHFAVDGVKEGLIELIALSPPGGDYGSGNSQAQAGDTNVVVRLGVQNGNNGRMITMSGTVSDASGAPVSGVRLWGETPFATASVTNGPDGKYSITWEIQANNRYGPIPKSRAIYARDLAHNLAVRQEFDDTATNLDLRLQSGVTLAVKVEDVNGKPIPTATAIFSLASGQQASFLRQTRSKADEEGIILVKALPQGLAYNANITAQGYGPGFARAIADETQTNRFDFPTIVLRAADCKLAGYVLDGNHKTLAGAVVSFSGEGQPSLPPATTDQQGHFAFAGVCEGPVTIFARGPTPAGGVVATLNRGRGQEVRGGETNLVLTLGDKKPEADAR